MKFNNPLHWTGDRHTRSNHTVSYTVMVMMFSEASIHQRVVLLASLGTISRVRDGGELEKYEPYSKFPVLWRPPTIHFNCYANTRYVANQGYTEDDYEPIVREGQAMGTTATTESKDTRPKPSTKDKKSSSHCWIF